MYHPLISNEPSDWQQVGQLPDAQWIHRFSRLSAISPNRFPSVFIIFHLCTLSQYPKARRFLARGEGCR